MLKARQPDCREESVTKKRKVCPQEMYLEARGQYNEAEATLKASLAETTDSQV